MKGMQFMGNKKRSYKLPKFNTHINWNNPKDYQKRENNNFDHKLRLFIVILFSKTNKI